MQHNFLEKHHLMTKARKQLGNLTTTKSSNNSLIDKKAYSEITSIM